MITIVREPLSQPDLALVSTAIRVERLRLAKRLWRGVAEDGREFGFELETPLKPEQTVWEGEGKRYVIVQEPEPVLEIALNITPAAAAGIGWTIGNLHLELSAEPTRLLTPDDPATRQLLDRIAVPFLVTSAVFRPGRFVRGGPAAGASAQELGASHQH